jgi:UDP-N-acetylglucosamine--N-acetylmuramyl-(pentapeptide) pyrophosphoryl-undecaprenol N-acetylglucosamine transferase
MKTKRVIISGGGTGGHLYPALVLGRTLRDKVPELEIFHVGSRRDAEKRIMAAHRTRFIAMPIEGLKGRGLRSFRGLGLLPGAFIQSFALLLRLRPALVVGVGGYSSGPIVLLAAWMGIPTLIMEQNVQPGFTNRLLRRYALKAVVAFEESLPYFRNKGVLLGNPVRREFAALPPKSRTDRLSVLVFGGSQGSRFLNQGVGTALPLLAGLKDRLEIVHQTGPAGLDEVRRRYAENGFDRAEVEAYFDDMPSRFGRADLVICRAGATTCAELVAAGKAALLVPFAGASEGHQTPNAAALEKSGGAEVLPESEFTPIRLAERIRRFLSHPEELTAMERALAVLKKPQADRNIADLCLTLMAGGSKDEPSRPKWPPRLCSPHSRSECGRASPGPRTTRSSRTPSKE